MSNEDIIDTVGIEREAGISKAKHDLAGHGKCGTCNKDVFAQGQWLTCRAHYVKEIAKLEAQKAKLQAHLKDLEQSNQREKLGLSRAALYAVIAVANESLDRTKDEELKVDLGTKAEPVKCNLCTQVWMPGQETCEHYPGTGDESEKGEIVGVFIDSNPECQCGCKYVDHGGGGGACYNCTLCPKFRALP